MKLRLLFSLLGLSLAQAALAEGLPAGTAAAGQSTGLAAADPELNWRDPRWLSRQREQSRWRYQLGVEQQLRSPVQFGPQAAVREAVWAGVSYDFTRRLSGGVESPVWERDTGWASRMAFQKSKKEGLAGLRGAFSYQLSPQSRLTLRPRARNVMLSYSATW
ncbi:MULTISPECIES: hypothetical protein [unclassified Roseateles]|uniref:hypothetical protein n=1 Tax=unclassified Roseateles TaxID=2626991 RepID=UPI0006F7530D|nr:MULTISPECIES: hypothetical protein [unclassified Roseateles]KQW42278.1 hypothetical protein ASC81_20670 [Pelomonas sp. Root405]KRA68152.1 hypothetical protein ASD88_22255 [Pelomonas sp. Root662]